MRYGSVCSGIEAATAAWHPLGWTPSFFSEIDRFPRAVLKHHYPQVTLHGDFTTIKRGDYDPIDLLVGGSPCQSFSIAGLRAGLDDDRGNLALEFIRLADRLRPRWIVWENVPGVFSAISHTAPDPVPPPPPVDMGCDGAELETEDEYDSEELHAFECFLAGLQDIGYGLAYRVLDAQYVRVDGFPYAVPQRRRRVFVVGYIGDWRRAAAVLSEPEGLRGDPPPRRKAGQEPAGTVTSSLERCSAPEAERGGLVPEVCGALNDGAHNGGGSTDKTPTADVFCPSVANPLTHRMHKGINTTLDEGQTPIATIGAVAFKPSHFTRGKDGAPSDVTPPLSADADKGDQDPVIAFAQPFSIMPMNSGKDNKARPTEVSQPLMTNPVGGNQGGDYIASDWRVRRLTPVECERLQGFPDDFTRIPWRSKPADKCPDGPRYKALGNSMAVNVMRAIGERIAIMETLDV